MKKRTILRSMIALFGAFSLAGGLPAYAEPEDDVRALLLRAEDVTATGVATDKIIVGWTDRSLIESGYRVEMSMDEEGTYTAVRETGPCNGPLSLPQPLPNLLAPANTGSKCIVEIASGPESDVRPRWFRVVPFFDSPGLGTIEGAPSAVDPAILAPRPPTELRCNGGPSCAGTTSITLDWKDNSDETKFYIFRARGRINPVFSLVPHAERPANTTTYSEGGLDLDTFFHYKVSAVREMAIPRSDGSTTREIAYADSQSPQSVRVETPRVAPPVDPSGLVALFVPPQTVSLTWTDNATNEDGYYVEWGPSRTEMEFGMTSLGNPDTGTVTWEDHTVPPDSYRCYRVRAWRASGLGAPAYSGFSNIECVGAVPLAPSDLVALAIANNRVDLTWKDNSTTEESFVIQRCTGVCTPAGAWADTVTAGRNATAASDTTTVGSTTYSYRVLAANGSGRSTASNIVTVLTPPTPIAAPALLDATAVGSHAIEVSFDDVTTNETGFRIEFRTAGGSWETLTHLGPHTGAARVIYVDRDTLSANQERCYRARTLRTNEVSDPSNVDCATTLDPLPPSDIPGDFRVDFSTNKTLGLSWDDTSTVEQGWRLEIHSFTHMLCSDPAVVSAIGTDGADPDTIPDGQQGFPYLLRDTIISSTPDSASTRVNFVVDKLVPHTSYFFRIRAFNQDGQSGFAYSACADTDGPKMPVILDSEGEPARNGNLDAMRCEVRVRAPSTGARAADRIQLVITAAIPGATPYSVETKFIEAPMTPGGDIWRLRYEFRKGINYGLIATAIGPGPERYGSADHRVRDIQVLADCPLGGPVP